ncbi:MAG: NfeD family protein [Acidimicrobiia bacterium]|nr:NfeD family protein [Acidimicrobiia bacterium]
MLSFDTPAVLWVAVAIVSALIEVSIPHFGVIFASLGAVAAAIVAALGLGTATQLIVFVFVLVASLLVLRPRILARQQQGPGVPSRTQQLLGRDGVVTHDIDQVVGAGRVNVGGEDWAARAKLPLPTGTRIRVVGADGIVLEVTPA